jgi:hypothetical protein
MSLAEYDIKHHNSILYAKAPEGSSVDVNGLVEELGGFVANSKHIIGAVVVSNAEENNMAFVGGHTAAYSNDYGTVTVHIDTSKAIRDATRLLTPKEGTEGIADAYTVPERLIDPKTPWMP